MIDRAVMSSSPGETRIALMARHSVVEFIIDRGGAAAGDVIEGKVVGKIGALGAVFVEIGEPLPGYLAKGGELGMGNSVLVEVTVAARLHKGAELKRAPANTAPRRRRGLARALAAYPKIERVEVDAAADLANARALFSGAVHEPGCFEESGAAEILDMALERRRVLPTGPTLLFAETEAGTMIDIDGGHLAPAAANEAALPEIATQLRLRGIAGHVLIDLIPSRAGPAKSIAEFKTLVAHDPAPVQVAGRTPLGMIELTRRRSGPSLAEIMLEPAAGMRNAITLGLDAVRALLRETVMRPGLQFGLVVEPRLAHALYARPDVLAEASRRLGRKLELVERADVEGFEVEELVR